MPSFDIVSKTDMAEIGNAVAGVSREISQRFDFKGSKSSVELKDGEIILPAQTAARRRLLGRRRPAWRQQRHGQNR